MKNLERVLGLGEVELDKVCEYMDIRRECYVIERVIGDIIGHALDVYNIKNEVTSTYGNQEMNFEINLKTSILIDPKYSQGLEVLFNKFISNEDNINTIKSKFNLIKLEFKNISINEEVIKMMVTCKRQSKRLNIELV